VELVNIPIGGDGRFSVEHRFSVGREWVFVWLEGVVDRGGRVHGTSRVHHADCDTGRAPFASPASSQ